jgi:hypothetical protein
MMSLCSSNYSKNEVLALVFVFHSTFDPPKADKCLLACGELDLGCLPAFGGARGDQGSMFIFFSKPSSLLPDQKITYRL